MTDFSDYQTAETAWRYDHQVYDAERAVERTLEEHRQAIEKLNWLRHHPPLYAYFNWSAW